MRPVHPRIDRLQRRSAEDARVIGFAGGLPPESSFPKDALVRALRRALGDGTAALQYGWPEGRDQLRAWIGARLATRGVLVAPDDVIITSGAQQAIAIAVQLVARRGERVAVADETYPAALDLLETRGIAPAADPRAAAAAYAMPAIANPRGDALTARARAALLDSGVPIIEDDAYADLTFAGDAPRPLVADARDRVFYVGTFSKTLCPGLRVGWLIVPPRLRRRALRVKHAVDLQANSLAQALLEEYLATTDWDARLRRLRASYARRAERLARALARHLPSWRFDFPAGGFSIWAETGEAGDDADFLATAIAHGVSFDPGREFRRARVSSPIALRLCFSAVPERRMNEGIARLSRAWDAFRRGRAKIAV